MLQSTMSKAWRAGDSEQMNGAGSISMEVQNKVICTEAWEEHKEKQRNHASEFKTATK